MDERRRLQFLNKFAATLQLFFSGNILLQESQDFRGDGTALAFGAFAQSFVEVTRARFRRKVLA